MNLNLGLWEVSVELAACMPRLGLFAKRALKVGHVIPAKGVWLNSMAEAAEFTNTAAAMHLLSRVVKVDYNLQGDTKQQNGYLVMTGLTGFCNAWQGIAPAPNCEFIAVPEASKLIESFGKFWQVF